MSEEFESAKISLHNAEEINNMKCNPVVKAAIISVSNSVPVIGALIKEQIDETLTSFQENKRNELLDIILSDSEHITPEMVNDVEFIMNFAKTLEAVSKLATNDKVKYFANLLKNGYFTDEKIENDNFEEYLMALSTLSNRQISILVELYNHEQRYVGRSVPSDKTQADNKLLGRNENWKVFVDEIQRKYAIDSEDLNSLLTAITKTGLCCEITGAYFDYSGGVFYITKYCEKFIQRILEQEIE